MSLQTALVREIGWYDGRWAGLVHLCMATTMKWYQH